MLRKQDPALGAPVHPADSSSVRPRNPAPPQCRSGTGASVIDFAATRRSLTPGNAKVGIPVGPPGPDYRIAPDAGVWSGAPRVIALPTERQPAGGGPGLLVVVYLESAVVAGEGFSVIVAK